MNKHLFLVWFWLLYQLCWLKPLIVNLTNSPWCISTNKIHLGANKVAKTCFFLIDTTLQIKSCQYLIFCFSINTFHGHVWKFHQLLSASTLSLDWSVKWKTFITCKLLCKKSWNFQWMLVLCDGFCMPKLRLEERTGRWRQNTERTPIFRAKSFFSLLFFGRSCLYSPIMIKLTKQNPWDQSWNTNSYS